ncbi:hypothetical protein IVB22_32235 [Bradyrhizobium sp. 190]|uniref:hypothetical protein n=1 Tax=Bradyrhizobium sp. 190 TaxID=2782658 RepID=UPI001FF71C75|nr:hypothetical protein [Bradyrhizobium sp. 190]MCK1517093.1 hypothetical protein [Bradyrhizobium sp. 190]
MEEDMEQRKSVPEGQAGVASNAAALPIWLRHTTRRAPERRRTILEHVARRKFIWERQPAVAPDAPGPSRKGGAEFMTSSIT